MKSTLLLIGSGELFGYRSWQRASLLRWTPMKAVRIHQHGGPEVLKYEDIPEPTIKPNEVLLRVRACALNHLDLWVRNGLPGINQYEGVEQNLRQRA
jgi:hypothetical protein